MAKIKIQTTGDSDFVAFALNVIETANTGGATFTTTAITLPGANGDELVLKGNFTYAEGQPPSFFSITGGSASQLVEVSAESGAYATLSGVTISLEDVLNALQTSSFDALIANIGSVTFIGNAGDDIATGFLGKDTLSGAGGDDSLSGYFGNDTINGDAGIDLLKGGEGNDRLNGGANRDTLSGQAGNDILDGGAAHDLLSGSTGADTFVLSDIQSSSDKIKDFSTGKDTLRVSASDFGGGLVAHELLTQDQLEINTTGHASTADARFIFDISTGILSFDPTGSAHGSTDAHIIATLQGGVTTLSTDDFSII